MDWDQLAREWRRVVDYVKSKFGAGDDESADDDEGSSLLGRSWPAREPALARIPRR